MQKISFGIVMLSGVGSVLGDGKLKDVSNDSVTGDAESIGFHLVTVGADGCSVRVVDNLSRVLLSVTDQWVVCIEHGACIRVFSGCLT